MYAQLPVPHSAGNFSGMPRNPSGISTLAGGTDSFQQGVGSGPGLGEGNGRGEKVARGFLPSPIRTVRVR
jgi:hypothetical protein